jgi:ABC-type multidrug transport system ATPase subunit
LFLDEPLAGLDAAGTQEVMNLLRDLSREEDLTLVIVEHVFNIPLILDLATTVWTLKDRKISVEDSEEVRAELSHDCADGVRARLQDVSGHVGEVVTNQLQGGVVLTKLAGDGVQVGEPVLEVRDLVVRRGGRLVIGERQPGGDVRGLSFTLRRGEIGLLEAPNGWGKTTLLEAIAGLLPVTCGTITICGRDVTALPAWERVKAGATFLQSRNNTFPALSVEESLRLSGSVRVPDELARFKHRLLGDLSGGEKQKVAAACALEGRPFTLALLDEPFSALDRGTTDRLMKSLPALLRQSGLLIAVPHGHGEARGRQN